MRILLVDTSYPINSRNLRIINSLKSYFGDENVRYATWRREDAIIHDSDVDNYILSLYSPLGDSVKKLRNMLKFRKYIKDTIKDFQPKIVIASHWDSLVVCSSLSKSFKLVYENLDMPTGNKLIFSLLRCIEKICLKKVEIIVFASRFFIPYYTSFNGKKILLENLIPDDFSDTSHQKSLDDDKLTITYNGTLRYPEIFENFFNAVGNLPSIEVKIFGYGVGCIGERIKTFGSKFSNIHFYGAYSYNQVPTIYSETDLVWAVYPARDFNVKVAISNKYQESLFFKVPGIFAKGTCLGDMVEKKGIGFQVDGYSVTDIRSLILEIQKNKKQCISDIRQKITDIKVLDSVLWKDHIDILIKALKEELDN